MPILQNILLGVFVGQYVTFAKVDSVWWPYLGTDLNSLKSKVPFTARSNSASFYKSMHESAYNFDYFMLASLVLLILSFVGGVVQYKGGRRVLNALSLITITAAVVVELVFSRDLVSRILNKSGGKVRACPNDSS